jgi:2-hydroxychromene-2-carboxylate isomerase
VFHAYFSAGADITNPDILANCAADAGIAEAEFREALEQTGSHEQVADWTQELVRQGGFGTPSVFVGDELFFGNDRIPLVDWRISPISDATFVMPGQHG